jgi:hypothetical protein
MWTVTAVTDALRKGLSPSRCPSPDPGRAPAAGENLKGIVPID